MTTAISTDIAWARARIQSASSTGIVTVIFTLFAVFCLGTLPPLCESAAIIQYYQRFVKSGRTLWARLDRKQEMC